MHTTLTTLIDRLDRHELSDSGVIEWSAPVPSFGDLSRSLVATLGLNPSNREFVDEVGEELDGVERRFHTLRSLNLDTWLEADHRHLEQILRSCRTYFHANPYDRWFRKLDQVIEGTGQSFYDREMGACHLDLIPYATATKWVGLSTRERRALFQSASDTIGLLLQDSPVRVLVLNGRSVVERFQEIAGVELASRRMPSWTLPRSGGEGVRGFAFRGEVEEIGSVTLGRPLLVLGYNHNIQSSFGVTSKVITRIRHWIARAARPALA